jgi:adenylate kinase family enzyme
MLSDEYGFCHLSIGDTLRRLVSESTIDLVAASQVQRGKLVSTEVLVNILRDSVKENVCSGRHLILVDGLPRQLDQALPVEEKVSVRNC